MRSQDLSPYTPHTEEKDWLAIELFNQSISEVIRKIAFKLSLQYEVLQSKTNDTHACL